MTRSDRERWDARYTDAIRSLYKGPPQILIDHAPPYRPGIRALEMACGLGRSALWLAAQGYTVDAIDISLTALRKARAEMLRRDLTGANFIVADLDHFPLPVYAYDLAYVFRFLDRDLFPALRERVRPGGTVIYRTFNQRRLAKRPDTSRDQLLHVGELPDLFPGWDVVHYAETGDVSAFVGRKPEA